MKRTFILAWVFSVLNISGLFAQQAVGLDSVSLAPADAAAGKTSLYTLSFSPSENLSAAASLILEFPQVFDLSGVLLAGSNNINGGFLTQINGTTLRLTRKGGGDLLPGNRSYSLMFGNVGNPGAGQYSIQITAWQGQTGSAGDDAAAAAVSIVAGQ